MVKHNKSTSTLRKEYKKVIKGKMMKKNVKENQSQVGRRTKVQEGW